MLELELEVVVVVGSLILVIFISQVEQFVKVALIVVLSTRVPVSVLLVSSRFVNLIVSLEETVPVGNGNCNIYQTITTPKHTRTNIG